MGNKTIYVKDETLWTHAKQLAGKEGLSALIAQALRDFVERKEQETDGFLPRRIPIHSPTGPRTLRFNGDAVNVLKRRDSVVEFYQTKAGNFVAVFMRIQTVTGVISAGSSEAFDYKTYDSLNALLNDETLFDGVSAKERSEFVETTQQILGEPWTVWVD